MNKKDSVKLINRIKNEYRPYPTNGDGVRVLAHYLPEAMEHEDVYENGTMPCCFEFFTRQQVSDVINNNVDAFGLFSYSFVSYLPIGGPEADSVKSAFSNSQYAWVILKDPKDVSDNDIHHIEGTATITCEAQQKAYDEAGFPSLLNIAMCWGSDGSSGDTASRDNFVSSLSNFSVPYDDGTIDSVEGAERKLFSDGTDYTIKVFKVGSANTAFVKHKSGETLLIDCGIDNTYVGKGTMTARPYIKNKIKPTNILISHWHSDHYNMLGAIDASNLSRVIIPNTGTMDANTQALLYKWHAAGVQLFKFASSSPANFLGAIFPGLDLYIGLGNTPTPADQSQKCVGTVDLPAADTMLNNSGIIVTINVKDRIVILPADVSYYNWPKPVQTLLPNAEKIVVPHHSGQVYGMLNVPKDTNPLRKIYISSFGTQFIDRTNSLGINYHRSYVDNLLNDTTNSKHLYTDDIKNASMPYYMLII